MMLPQVLSPEAEDQDLLMVRKQSVIILKIFSLVSMHLPCINRERKASP